MITSYLCASDSIEAIVFKLLIDPESLIVACEDIAEVILKKRKNFLSILLPKFLHLR